MTTQVELTTADELLQLPDGGCRYELVGGGADEDGTGWSRAWIALDFGAE